jgi:hypothetical protein
VSGKLVKGTLSEVLDMKKFSSRSAPRELTAAQKAQPIVAEVGPRAESRRGKRVYQYNHGGQELGPFVVRSLITVEYIQGSGANSTA